jgi:hypothetical protein
VSARVHRLLGQDEAAELAYRRATSLGASVQPGLALLRLRQGNASTAANGLHRAVAEATRAPARGRLLLAVVTIALAADDVAEAKQALTELERLTQVPHWTPNMREHRARSPWPLAVLRPHCRTCGAAPTRGVGFRLRTRRPVTEDLPARQGPSSAERLS